MEKILRNMTEIVTAFWGTRGMKELKGPYNDLYSLPLNTSEIFPFKSALKIRLLKQISLLIMIQVMFCFPMARAVLISRFFFSIRLID